MLYLLPGKQYGREEFSLAVPGDGKIISVAEEKFPLCEISGKHARPQPQNNVDQRTQTSGAMRLRLSEQRCLFIFSKITSEDNQPLHMREHLECQRFRL